MKLKTLLLGSAAAFAVVGGAQAADLSVAEPVEYVKACEVFGAGYYYIPGSDTCLKISGNVTFYADFHNNSAVITSASAHSASWDFTTYGGAYFDAKSMTDVGVLEASIGFKGTYTDNDNYADGAPVGLDGAFLAIGALKAGHYGPVFNPGGSYFDNDIDGAIEPKSGLADDSQIDLSFKAANLAIVLGIEDPRESFGSSLPASYSMPLIDGSITASSANWVGFLSGAAVQLANGTAWGVDGQLTFNIGANDHFKVNAAYGANAFVLPGLNPTAGGYTPSNNAWSAFASLSHAFSSTLATNWDVGYQQPETPSLNAAKWIVEGDLLWTPYAGFSAALGGIYSQASGASSGTWVGEVELKRQW